MSNTVIEILEDMHLIRPEWRSGARWYELTHDRLIKPIKDSNKAWYDERDKERLKAVTEANEKIRKRYSKLKIIVPIILVGAVILAIIIGHFGESLFRPNQYIEPTINACARHPIMQIGNKPYDVSCQSKYQYGLCSQYWL